MKIILFVIAVSLLSCRSEIGENDVWIKPESTTISCNDYYNIQNEQGVFNNNVWNKQAAKKDIWNQCIEKRVVDGSIQFGWSWTWPIGRKVIYSYPQIKIGSSPWAPEPRIDESFPLEISDLRNMDISHDIEIETNGEHNTATTMWLVTEPYKGDKPNPSIIAAEVMIWTYSTKGHFNPAGNKFDELTIGDTTWEVWYKKDWSDMSGANKNKWVSVSFRAKRSSMTANIPALDLLNYAISRELLSKELYIADVELGNEIMGGSGITWVKKFSVIYKIES